jgi:NAD(P)-dependent dehydrogenase (short-subunit alcohol dehydrogenase family)
MSEQRAKSALITSASTGLGKDLARQLAQRQDFDWIYLGCRNPAKAERAMSELQQVTGRSIFEIVLIDLSDTASVRAAVPAITRPLNAAMMNAGGTGGPTPGALMQDGGCPSA